MGTTRTIIVGAACAIAGVGIGWFAKPKDIDISVRGESEKLTHR